jgi:hypothetical protein
MEMKKLRRAAGVTAAVVAVGAGGVAAIGASASDAGKAGGGHVAKIKMEVKGKGKHADLFFQGPNKVEKGSKLKIINKTLPSKFGPHTFTLVKKNRLPNTKQEIKKCENLKLAVCVNVLNAHKVGPPPTFEVGKPKVEVGKKGWDKSFGKTGDSWLAEAKGAHNTRKVSANDGKTLHYFCLVHPFMQGKIKVVK